MIIKISDIPVEGRDVSFSLQCDLLNKRINSVGEVYDKKSIKPPEYVFSDPPLAEVSLQRQGSTVVMQGVAKGQYSSPCSRCASNVETPMSTKFRIVLKPRPKDEAELEEEDIEFGYYTDKEINCAEVVEEIVVLELPYAVYCTEVGKECEVVEVSEDDSAQEEAFVDERFAVLKNIKLN